MNFVSIITATYNSEKYILEVYESIKKQKHENWEWIVTDDFSTDKTFDILKSIANKDKRVKIFQNHINSGAALSRNNSMKNAAGEFIAFIDSDDLWFPDKLSKQIQFMNENNIDFSFTSYELINEKGESLNKYIDIKNKNSSYGYYDMLKKKATLGCSTVVLRRSKIKKMKMPNIRTGQDYAFWLNILKEGVKAHLFREVLTKYRITPGSISRNKIKKALRQWGIYRHYEHLNYFKSILCFVSYAKNAIFRK
ncbi:glycosyltransferase family 2 protein [Escherichia coli]